MDKPEPDLDRPGQPMTDTQQWTADHVLAYETNYEAWHGEPPPIIAELKARMRKDKLGLRHSASEPADDE
jgi:hypothetical protein